MLILNKLVVVYSDWSTDFSDAPNFAWGDLYCYLINNKGYDQESLKAYKSLKGYRLHCTRTRTTTLLRFNLNVCDSHKFLKHNLNFNFYQKLKRTPLQIDPRQKSAHWYVETASIT